MEIIAYQGKNDWVEAVIMQAQACLMNETIPGYSPTCEYCTYRKAAQTLEVVTPQQKPASSTAQGELFA